MPISSRARGPLVRCLCLAATAVALGAAPPAGAAVVTVGSPLSGTAMPGPFGGAATVINRLLGEPGANVTSPVSGAIVRWRITDASGGPFRLRVLTLEAGGTYAGAGTSAPGTPIGTGLQIFDTDLPIKAGQTIALNSNVSGDAVGVFLAAGSAYAKWEPQLADGQTTMPIYSSPTGIEIAFNADVLPVPTVTGVTPTSGSFKGGTGVVIAGTSFAEVKSVSFGSTPAENFKVDSEGEIAATAPAATGPGPVDVTVTTIAGTSPVTAADQFTNTACVVPKLTGKKLKTAKKKLKKAGCKLGTAKGDKSKSAKVKSQGPKAGKVLAPGSKVNVKLAE